MTTPNLVAALATVLGCAPDELPEPAPYDEGLEARIDQVAASWDADTRTYRRLGPRRSW